MSSIGDGLRGSAAVIAAQTALDRPAWVVGGAVRDAALGRPVVDADLAVNAGAEEASGPRDRPRRRRCRLPVVGGIRHLARHGGRRRLARGRHEAARGRHRDGSRETRLHGQRRGGGAGRPGRRTAGSVERAAGPGGPRSAHRPPAIELGFVAHFESIPVVAAHLSLPMLLVLLTFVSQSSVKLVLNRFGGALDAQEVAALMSDVARGPRDARSQLLGTNPTRPLSASDDAYLELQRVHHERVHTEISGLIQDDGTLRDGDAIKLLVSGGLRAHTPSTIDLAYRSLRRLLLVELGVGGLLVIGGLLLNFNRFSLHAVYRDRLIRAFLGASNKRRTHDAFTGFDTQDNIPMHQLRRGRLFTAKDLGNRTNVIEPRGHVG